MNIKALISCFLVPPQGCALRRITGYPKAPNHEFWGAQPLSILQKKSFSSHLKTKISSLRPPGAARAQPCSFIITPLLYLIRIKIEILIIY